MKRTLPCAFCKGQDARLAIQSKDGLTERQEAHGSGSLEGYIRFKTYSRNAVLGVTESVKKESVTNDSHLSPIPFPDPISISGRAHDGENANIGFVDVTDQPYPELIKAVKEVTYSMYERRLEN